MTTTPNEDLYAAAPADSVDLEVLADLGRIYKASDPMPADLPERVKFAMTVAALEAEVAELVSAPMALTRSTEYQRATTMTFAAGDLTVLVNIEPGSPGRVLISGWVTQVEVEVELRERARSTATRVDSEGRFSFREVERGMVHFVIRRLDDPEAHPVITPAVEV